jgi:glycosyltransferase involved in cell wall biosynthesis
MFAGKPFVATNAGGTADLALYPQPAGDGAQQARNGFIVDRNAEVIVTCLGRLSKARDLRDTMGRNGKANAMQNWSSERLLREMKQLYYELAASSKTKAQSA